MDSWTLDHVAVAVPSLPEALALFQRLVGGDATPPERVEAQGVDVAFLGPGPVRLELLAPTRPDSPVARFLARRGPGLHHLAYAVPDLDAALARCRTLGFEPVDPAPRPGAGGHLVAFLHPRTTAGVLVELVQAPRAAGAGAAASAGP